MSSIACNKLTRANVEKLLSSTVFINMDGQTVEVDNTNSANDIQLYIELSKLQDCMGRVEGISYLEFMDILGCSKATFYNSLERLERLEYIKAVSDRKGKWDITILNNIFLSEEDYKQSYMRTNVDFLYSDEFKKMSLVSKKICLYLHLNKNTYRKLEVYLATLAKGIGIKILSVVKDALEAVKKFFPHMFVEGKQGKKLVFEASRVSKNEETEDANYIKHKLKVFCDRHNIKYTKKDIEDVSILSGQYSKKLSFQKFISIVMHVLFVSTRDNSLRPNYINSVCKIESAKLAQREQEKIEKEEENILPF